MPELVHNTDMFVSLFFATATQHFVNCRPCRHSFMFYTLLLRFSNFRRPLVFLGLTQFILSFRLLLAYLRAARADSHVTSAFAHDTLH